MLLRRIRQLRFALTDAKLKDVIDVLGVYNPSMLNPRAWDALMTEVKRRHRGEPAQAVVMWNGVYETLPTPVQRVLRQHVTGEQPGSRKA